jgi:hypothetical protein
MRFYPWPTYDVETELSEALDIAMSYLEKSGQAENYREVESLAATVILSAYRSGVRQRIALANKAIVAVEKNLIHTPVPGVWYG